MRRLLQVVVLVAVVAGVIWFVQQKNTTRATNDVKNQVGSAVEKAKDAVADIDVDGITDEIKRTGRVVRRKAASAVHAVAEATEDARTTAAIKARIAIDPHLSVLDISVDTTEGRVTLAGSVERPEDVARAVRLVLEDDNVREVVSTLHVRTLAPQKITLAR